MRTPTSSMADARTFIDVLRGRAAERPDHVALSFLENGETLRATLTYQVLDRRARDVAAGLRQTVRPRERVLLLHPPGLEFAVAFFGCLYADVVPVPVYPPRNQRHFSRLEGIVADAETQVVLTQTDAARSLSAWLEGRAADLSVLCTDQLLDGADAAWEPSSLAPDTVAFLQYTSGSTGEPKGVMVTHANLMGNHRMIHQAFGLAEGLVVVSWLPIYHDMGLIGSLMQPLYEGGHCVLMSPAAFLQQPRRWLAAMTQYRAHTSGGPNFALRLCSRTIRDEQKSGLDLSGLEVLFCGSEPIAARDLDDFADAFRDVGFRREALYCCYGMAEATLLVTGSTRGAGPIVTSVDAEALSRGQVHSAGVDGSSRVRPVVGCGRAAPGVDIAVVDAASVVLTADGAEADQSLGEGRVGEIWVRGEHVAAGYWRKPDLTRATFEARLSGPDRAGEPYLRTGDLGFLQSGEVFVTGRLKDLIIIRGRNYYPQDIERSVQRCHLALHDQLGAAFSAPIDDEESLIVVQEVDRHYQGDWDALVASVRAAVVEEHDISPASVVLVRQGGVPKTSSGKIRRNACARAYADGLLPVLSESRHVLSPLSAMSAAEEAVQRSREDIEAFFVERVARDLGMASHDVDVTQPFSAFGLDSARTLSLLAEAEAWLGRQLSPTVFWDYPTIETLSAHLGDERQRSAVPSERG